MAVARATRLIAARLYVPSPKVVLKATYQGTDATENGISIRPRRILVDHFLLLIAPVDNNTVYN